MDFNIGKNDGKFRKESRKAIEVYTLPKSNRKEDKCAMIVGIMCVMTKHQIKFSVSSVLIGMRKINNNRTTRKHL
jgi:hypothetical protein